MLIFYLAMWSAYIVVLFSIFRAKKLRFEILFLSQMIPSAVALLMFFIFIVGGGGTIAQLVSGSKSGSEMWRLWFHLWPILLFASGFSAVSHFIWTAIVSFMPARRVWIGVSATGLVISALGFLTVITNFPDA